MKLRTQSERLDTIILLSLWIDRLNRFCDTSKFRIENLVRKRNSDLPFYSRVIRKDPRIKLSSLYH